MGTNTQPIPLMILTGFLGAGKTTVLNRLLHGEHGLKIAVMVNDFGAINIDAQLVVDIDTAEEMINLSNGCICCTIRGDLVNAVLQLTEREDKPDFIVIETSGVSDPIDVVLTLRAIQKIKIDSVITVIDAEQVTETFSEYEILTLNQIGTADIVLLNKVDLVDTNQRESVKQFVEKIAPKARIFETIQGDVPLEIVLGQGNFDPGTIEGKSIQEVHVHDNNNAHHHDNHTLIFDTWSWSTNKPMSTKALMNFVKNLPNSIYRAKGIVFTVDSPDTRQILHVVGKRAEISHGAEWDTTSPSTQIVIIGQQGTIDSGVLSTQLESCLAENAPKNELERLANQALSWLRDNINS